MPLVSSCVVLFDVTFHGWDSLSSNIVLTNRYGVHEDNVARHTNSLHLYNSLRVCHVYGSLPYFQGIEIGSDGIEGTEGKLFFQV